MARTPTGPTAPTPTGPTGPTPTARTGPTPAPSSSEPSDFRSLATLVGEAAVPGFLASRLGADAYRTRIAPERARALFGWPQLNAALAEHRLAPPRLRLERAGADATAGLFRTRRTRRGAMLHDLDPAVLNQRLRDGATLIVDAVNELNPALQDLCAGLAAEFGAPCQANLYACWGTTQGFDVHWDDHDVFVVQVEGRKRWPLFGATRAAPTRKDHHGEHPRPETPIEEVVLEPGDVLYLPRGYWHAAVGLGEPTLHLTIGLTRKSGADFLHWLADQALADAAVRADLPLERGDAILGAHLAGVLAGLAAHDPEDLARRYRRHVEATQAHRPQVSLPFIGRENALEPGSTVRLAHGAARLDRTEGRLRLSWRGTVYDLAPALSHAMERLAAGERLAYADMEALLPADARPLLADFVAEMAGRGVFVVEPA